MQFLSTLLTIVIVIYVLGWLARYILPHLIVWLARRHVEKKMKDAFGQQEKTQSRQRRRSGWWPFGGDDDRDKGKGRKHGKIITSDVGEYVEFEEISIYKSEEDTAPKPHVKPEEQVDDAVWEDI